MSPYLYRIGVITYAFSLQPLAVKLPVFIIIIIINIIIITFGVVIIIIIVVVVVVIFVGISHPISNTVTSLFRDGNQCNHLRTKRFPDYGICSYYQMSYDQISHQRQAKLFVDDTLYLTPNYYIFELVLWQKGA